VGINRKSIAIGIVLGIALSATVLAISIAYIAITQGFTARQRPSVGEAKMARFVLAHSLPNRLRKLRNPIMPSTIALNEAREHYADHCASCHGNNGNGHTMYGDGMNPAPPDLTLAATQRKGDGELYSIIQNGVRWTGMPAFGSASDNDESTWKLVLFIRHLPALTPDEEHAMQKMNPITPSELKEQQEEDDFLSGSPTRSTGGKK
jgi:mono/diheme cytochrome c family protein